MALPLFLRRLPFLKKLASSTPIVPVVRIAGVIAADSAGPGRNKAVSLMELAAPLKKAFETPGAKAVALLINSPGGSPVQSHLIAKRIRAHAAEKELPVIAFCEDAAASGGYFIATAADEIYADESSILGSIGVISGGFGFHDLIGRYGVERRLYTAGRNKGMLDPFQEEKAEDVARLDGILGDLHEAFIAWVRERRGEKLQDPDGNELFSGAFWAGLKARDLGLIDGVDDLRSHMRAKFGEKVDLRLINAPKKSFIQSLLSEKSPAISERLGHAIGHASTESIAAMMEEKSHWNRLGL